MNHGLRSQDSTGTLWDNHTDHPVAGSPNNTSTIPNKVHVGTQATILATPSDFDESVPNEVIIRNSGIRAKSRAAYGEEDIRNIVNQNVAGLV